MNRRLLLPLLTATASYSYLSYKCKQIKTLDKPSPFQPTNFKTRDQHIKEVQSNPSYDLVVIGGGCNGTGVVLDASTRGFRTLLIQKNDFASGASSKSTKLIHGGVRYLEQVFALTKDSLSSRIQKFNLVKQAIYERSYMIKNAEYLTQKIPFVIPSTNFFKTMYYYAGSVVYYLIYYHYAPKDTVHFNFPTFMHQSELRKFFPYMSDRYTTGVVYQDGSFNDARMVIAALLTAAQGNGQMPSTWKKANILNQAEFIDFVKNKDTNAIQAVIFKDKISGKLHTVNCKYVVNCAGAWGDQIRLKDNPNLAKRIIHVAGSHITYDQRITNSKYGLTLPSKDGRVTLVVPWLGRVIAGTTEKTFQEPQINPKCSIEERMFLNEAMADVMDKLEPQKLLEFEKTRWCGLRPLVLSKNFKSTKDISRTHVIQKSDTGLYSLIGGKWTIYRKMGQDVMNQIVQQERTKGREYPGTFTKNLPLVGSCSVYTKNDLIDSLGIMGEYLYKTYGSRAEMIVDGDLTQLIGPMTISELKYIIENEMPTCPEDVLIRRTRSAFLLEKDKLFKLIPLVCKMMVDAKIVKLQKGQTLEKYINSTAQRINSLQFS